MPAEHICTSEHTWTYQKCRDRVLLTRNWPSDETAKLRTWSVWPMCFFSVPLRPPWITWTFLPDVTLPEEWWTHKQKTRFITEKWKDKKQWHFLKKKSPQNYVKYDSVVIILLPKKNMKYNSYQNWIEKLSWQAGKYCQRNDRFDQDIRKSVHTFVPYVSRFL